LFLARKFCDPSHRNLCWLAYDFAEKIAVDEIFTELFFQLHCFSAHFGCPKDQDFLSRTVPGKRTHLSVHTGLTTKYVKTMNVEYLKYLCRPIPNVATCTHEIKSRFIIARASFNMKTSLVTITLDWNWRKKLVKCYIWSIAKIWTLRKAVQKYLESSQMWCWRRLTIIRTDRVKNETVLQKVKEERNMLHTIKQR
jgi:hypothetical protein